MASVSSWNPHCPRQPGAQRSRGAERRRNETFPFSLAFGPALPQAQPRGGNRVRKTHPRHRSKTSPGREPSQVQGGQERGPRPQPGLHLAAAWFLCPPTGSEGLILPGQGRRAGLCFGGSRSKQTSIPRKGRRRQQRFALACEVPDTDPSSPGGSARRDTAPLPARFLPPAHVNKKPFLLPQSTETGSRPGAEGEQQQPTVLNI